jgi:hypothetical protein
VKVRVERNRRWTVVSVHPAHTHYGAYGGGVRDLPLNVYTSKPLPRREAIRVARSSNATRTNGAVYFAARVG